MVDLSEGDFLFSLYWLSAFFGFVGVVFLWLVVKARGSKPGVGLRGWLLGKNRKAYFLWATIFFSFGGFFLLSTVLWQVNSIRTSIKSVAENKELVDAANNFLKKTDNLSNVVQESSNKVDVNSEHLTTLTDAILSSWQGVDVGGNTRHYPELVGAAESVVDGSDRLAKTIQENSRSIQRNSEELKGLTSAISPNSLGGEMRLGEDREEVDLSPFAFIIAMPLAIIVTAIVFAIWPWIISPRINKDNALAGSVDESSVSRDPVYQICRSVISLSLGGVTLFSPSFFDNFEGVSFSFSIPRSMEVVVRLDEVEQEVVAGVLKTVLEDTLIDLGHERVGEEAYPGVPVKIVRPNSASLSCLDEGEAVLVTPPFADESVNVTEAIEDSILAAASKLSSAGNRLSMLLFVGAADKRALSEQGKREFGSNYILAQMRAYTVQEALLGVLREQKPPKDLPLMAISVATRPFNNVDDEENRKVRVCTVPLY
jgi:hypothetical protein